MQPVAQISPQQRHQVSHSTSPHYHLQSTQNFRSQNSPVTTTLQIAYEQQQPKQDLEYPLTQLVNGKPRPIEVPFECVRKLVLAMDKDLDERVSFQELQLFVAQHNIPFDQDLLIAMFNDAVSKRAVVHQEQKVNPLTMEEIANCVRGRVSKDIRTKEFGVQYRPYRNKWLYLLEKVNERVLVQSNVPQIPKLNPKSDIIAQYQTQGGNKVGQTSKKHKEFRVVMPVKKPVLEKQYRTQGNVFPDPDGGVKVQDDQSAQVRKIIKPSPYDEVINGKIEDATNAMAKTGNIKEELNDSNNFPKFSFESQEYFSQAKKLSQMDNYWGEDKMNPIYTFLPKKVTDTKELMVTMSQSKKFLQFLNKNLEFGLPLTRELADYQSQTSGQFNTQQLRNTSTLQAAGLMSFGTIPQNTAKSGQQRAHSQDLGQTTGVRKGKRKWKSFFKIPDLTTYKQQIASQNPASGAYEPPSLHKFREDEPPLNQADFKLRYKIPKAYNHLGISQHDRRPRVALEKQKKQKERAQKQREEDYHFLLTGGPIDNRSEWVQYYTLPALKNDISTQKPCPTLHQETYEEPLLAMIRNMRDEQVQGKKHFNLNFRPLGPTEKNNGFSGKLEPFKTLF